MNNLLGYLFIIFGLLSFPVMLQALEIEGNCVPVNMWLALVDGNSSIYESGEVELTSESPSKRARYRYSINKGEGIAQVFESDELIAKDAQVTFLGPDRVSIQHQFNDKYIFTHVLNIKGGASIITESQFIGDGIQSEGRSLLCTFITK